MQNTVTQTRHDVEVNQQKNQQLLDKGESQGYVTFDDMLEVFPNAEHDLDSIEETLAELTRAGVSFQDGSLDDLSVEPRALAASRSNRPTSSVLAPEDEPSDEELDQLDHGLVDLLGDAGYQQALETDDVIGLYLKEAGSVPLLQYSEEISLAKRIERGVLAKQSIEQYGRDLPPDDRLDLEAHILDAVHAEEHLIRANARLVISIAKKYIGRGVPFLDLIQEGNIGLIRAVRKFEYQRGHKFSTYATWWIRQAVGRAVSDQGRTIRVPVHMGDQINRLRRISLTLTQELGRDPVIEELAVALETTPEKINDLLEIARRPVSLETPTDEDEESEIGDFVEDTTSPIPSEAVDKQMLGEYLQAALKRLPEREARILRLRYGLEDGEQHTLEDVGKMMGVTRERVRQLEAQALNRMRHSSSHTILKDFVTDLR